MLVQVNSRYINEEPNVLDGLLTNKTFVVIISAELLLQVNPPSSLHNMGGKALRMPRSVDPYVAGKSLFM